MSDGLDPKKLGLYIKTFGCQMNEYDSQKVAGLLSSGYRIVDSPEEAQVIFVNTCSVRDKAEQKLYSILGRYRALKTDNPELIVGVGGCVAQQEGKKIAKRDKVVDFVVGTHNLSLVPSLVENIKNKRGSAQQVAIDYREEWEDLPDDFVPLESANQSIHSPSFSLFQPVRALVSIQRGCAKNCAFCVVPRTRGPEVSRAADEVLREIKLKVSMGAKEVLLLGQTVNSYGKDLNPRIKFSQLVRQISDIDGVERIRFTSPHPAEVKPDFIQLYKEIPQLVPHIHLPLQSGNNRVLKIMNRNYRRERYLEIISELRAIRSDIAITSDIIVGFPTETEEEFEDTLDVMRQVRYHASYSFKYSKRPLTKAVAIFSEEEEIPKEVQSRRLTELQALQTEHSEERNAQYLNTEQKVLVEGFRVNSSKNISEGLRGRTPYNVLVDIALGENKTAESLVGSLRSVSISKSGAHGLRGNL